MKTLKPNTGKGEMKRLNRLLNSRGGSLKFLAYEIDSKSAEIVDELRDKTLVENTEARVLWALLSHFSSAKRGAKTGKLIAFRYLPGGYAYDNAFTCRAVKPISETFGEEPTRLAKAGKILGGSVKTFGDVSIEIPTFPLVDLVYILWEKGEFPASASILFDESASCFLPTEDLAILAEMTTKRLQDANKTIR